MKKYAALVTFVFVAATGCNSETKDTPPPTTSKLDATTSNSPPKSPAPDTKPLVTTDAPKPSQSSSESTPTPASKPPSASELPASLKHEGYEYEGLANSKPMDMELVQGGANNVITGSQSITLKEVKNGVATYTVERTGGLSVLGSEIWSLESDGIYTTSSSLASLSPRAMELPASPKPGMTWHFHLKSDNPDNKMDVENNCKVIGFEPVTTKARSYEKALLVEQNGSGTLRNQKVRTVSRIWYVKGIGTVKAQVKDSLPDGKSQTLTIQETKQ